MIDYASLFGFGDKTLRPTQTDYKCDNPNASVSARARSLFLVTSLSRKANRNIAIEG
jgi:hypothetical protein